MKGSVEDARIRNQKLPVSTIPTEISNTIFKIACLDSSPFTNGGQLSKTRAEVVISHVSHMWRSRSLACPEIWSTFAHDNYAVKISMDRLSVYLERSGSRPLDLWLVLSKNDVEPLAMALLLKFLIQHAKRWRRFSLSFDSQGIWPTSCLDPLEPLEAPNLQSFEIYIPYQNPDVQLGTFFEGGTPKLDSIRMDSISFESFILPSRISTLQIENLTGNSPKPWSIFLDILKCPNLTNLSLCRNIFLEPTYGDKGQTIVANQLKHFRCGDFIVAREMWSFLQAPGLELAIFNEIPLDDWNFPFNNEVAAQDTSPSLFPSLHTLALINCDFEDSDRPLLLAHATKAVTHLYIMHDTRFAESSVFHHIVQQCPETILWPNLETLSCMVEMGDELKPASCLEVVECRSRILQKHCILRLFDTEMQWWKSADQESWSILQDKGYYQRIGGYCEGDIDYVPWPPRSDSVFQRLAERKFLSHDDEFED